MKINEKIIQILNQLPIEQRVCVFYRYNDELSDTQIAEKLAISQDEVKSRLEIAEKVIREELAKGEEDEEERKKYLIIPLSALMIPAIKYGMDSGVLTIEATAATSVGAGGAGGTTAASAEGTTAAAPAITSTSKVIIGIAAGFAVIGVIIGLVMFSREHSPERYEDIGTPAIDPQSGETGEPTLTGSTAEPFETAGTSPNTPASNEYVPINLSNQGITDEILVQMIADGTIPMNVTELGLVGNQITDISPLSELTNLSWLLMSNNQVADVSPLSGLTNLVRLDLGRNQITDVSPLSSLTNLTGLYLNNNQITDISPLSSLTNLDSLNLGFNQVTDWSPVAHVENVQGRP